MNLQIQNMALMPRLSNPFIRVVSSLRIQMKMQWVRYRIAKEMKINVHEVRAKIDLKFQCTLLLIINRSV